MLCSLEEHASWLAQEAGTLLLGLFNQNLHVEYKSAGYRDPVSNADKAAEQLLISHIQNNFPKHGILSEETEDSPIMDCDFLWVLDPLDGTTNYVNHYPFFGVSLGILYQGIPVVGAIFVSTPLISGGQVVHARHGGGAFVGDVPVRVYDGAEPSEGGLISAPGGSWVDRNLTKALRGKLGEVRFTGSIAYELAMVASGVLQCASFVHPKIWDVAAGVIVIREAGGEVLVRGKNQRMEPLISFLQPHPGLPIDGDLRKWGAGMLVGNQSVLRLMADNFKPRRKLWPWTGSFKS